MKLQLDFLNDPLTRQFGQRQICSSKIWLRLLKAPHEHKEKINMTCWQSGLSGPGGGFFKNFFQLEMPYEGVPPGLLISVAGLAKHSLDFRLARDL